MRIVLSTLFTFLSFLAYAQIDSSGGSGGGSKVEGIFNQFSQEYKTTCENAYPISQKIKVDILKLLGINAPAKDFADIFDKKFNHYKQLIQFLEKNTADGLHAPINECSDCKIKHEQFHHNIIILFELDLKFSHCSHGKILTNKERDLLMKWFPENAPSQNQVKVKNKNE